MDRFSPNFQDLRKYDSIRDVAMTTNFKSELAKFAYPPVFSVVAFQNGLEDGNVDFKRLHGDDPSSTDRNLVMFFRPIVPEFTRLDRKFLKRISENAKHSTTI